MIVEFVGPPGAGKSTIAGHLAKRTGKESLTLDGYRTSQGRRLSALEMVLLRTWSIASQPSLALQALDCARHEGRGEAVSWMINLARRSTMARAIRKRDLILEEGTLSALCLAKAARTHPWDPVSALPALSYGQVVVLVNVTPELAVQRIKARAGILADRGKQELLDLVGGYQLALQDVAPMLDAHIVPVAADRPPELLAAAIQDSIGTLLKER